MKTEPNKNEVSATVLARHLDVTTKTTASLAQAGVIARLAHGRYDLEKSVTGYIRHLRSSRTPAASEVAVERAALLRLQRQRAQARFDQETGELVTITDVMAHWDSVLRTLRSGVLALPARCAARVPGVTREMAYEMDLEVRELLTELARNGYPAPVVEEKTTP